MGQVWVCTTKLGWASYLAVRPFVHCSIAMPGVEPTKAEPRQGLTVPWGGFQVAAVCNGGWLALIIAVAQPQQNCQ